MIQDQDQFAPLGRCELCGDPLTEGPKTYEGASAHTHFYDTPEEQAKYAHKFFTGTRKKNYDKKTAATPDAQAALGAVLPKAKVSDEAAAAALPATLGAPVDTLRESIIGHASDPSAARGHVESVVSRRVDPVTKTSSPTERFGGISSSASGHVNYMSKMLSHPSSSTFFRANVIVKTPDGGVRHLGSHHIDAVQPSAIAGISGINVGGSFYPDQDVHDVSYTHSPTAPRGADGNPLTQQEQHAWYEAQDEKTKSNLRWQGLQKSRTRKNIAADTDSEGVNVGRVMGAASPAGVSAASLAAKTRLMDTMVAHGVDTKTAESMHNIMDTRGVDATSAKNIHKLMATHGLDVESAHKLHTQMTGRS